jgi:hypothetical protein
MRLLGLGSGLLSGLKAQRLLIRSGCAYCRVSATGDEWVINLYRLLRVMAPMLKLLADHQGGEQCETGEQTLLNMQWRNTHLSETLAVHPGAPPPQWPFLILSDGGLRPSWLLNLLQLVCQLRKPNIIQLNQLVNLNIKTP